MSYKSSAVGEFEETRTGNQASNTIKVGDTRPSKWRAMSTKYFGNNTLTGDEGTPVIHDAINCGNERVFGEVNPVDTLKILPSKDDYGFVSNPHVDIGARAVSSFAENSGKYLPYFERPHVYIDGIEEGTPGKSFTPMTRYVSAHGRLFDTFKNKYKGKVSGAFTFGVGQYVTLTLVTPNEDISGIEYVIPQMVTYGKVTVNTMASRMDNENKKDYTRFPFPSFIFPFSIMTSDVDNTNIFDRYGSSFDDDMIGFTNSLNNRTGLASCTKNLFLDGNMFTDGLVAEHRGLVDEEEGGIYGLDTLALVNNYESHTFITYPDNSRLGNNFVNSLLDSFTIYPGDTLINDFFLQDLYNRSDGWFRSAYRYRNLKVFKFTGNTANDKITIKFKVTQIHNSQNTLNREDPVTGGFYHGGEGIYSLLPVEVCKNGTPVTEENGDYEQYYPYRQLDKDAPLDQSLISTFRYKAILWRSSLDEQALYCLITDRANVVSLVFVYDDGEYCTFPLNAESIMEIDNVNIKVKSVDLLYFTPYEKSILVTLDFNNIPRRYLLSIVNNKQYAIPEISTMNLHNNFRMTVRELEADEENVVLENQQESSNHSNSYKVSVDTPSAFSSNPFDHLFLAYQERVYNGEGHSLVPHNLNEVDSSLPVTNYPFDYQDFHYNSCYPEYRVTTPTVFLFGNKTHCQKSDLIDLTHDIGLTYVMYSPSLLTQGVGVHSHTVNLYEESIQLPMLYPYIYPMKNNNTEHTLIKLHNRDSYGIFRYDHDIFNDAIVGEVHKDNFFFNTHDDRQRYLWLNLHALAMCFLPEEPTSYLLDSVTIYKSLLRKKLMNINNTLSFTLFSVKYDYMIPYVGTIALFPSKKLGVGGVFNDIEPVEGLTGIDPTTGKIVNGYDLLSLNGQTYTTNEDAVYRSNYLFPYTSVKNEVANIGTLYPADGLVVSHTVGSYTFLGKGDAIEILFVDRNATVPIYSCTGDLVKYPLQVGNSIYFAYHTEREIVLATIRESKVFVNKRISISSTIDPNKAILFNKPELTYPVFLYEIEHTLKAIYLYDYGLSNVTLDNNSNIDIIHTSINNINQPPLFVSENKFSTIEPVVNTTNELTITSGNINLQYRDGYLFVITGIEVSTRHIGTSDGLMSLFLYNSFDNTPLFNLRDIVVDNSITLFEFIVDSSIRNVYYSIESQNLIINKIELVGYYVQIN